MHYFYWTLFVLLWFFAFRGQNVSLKYQHKLLAVYCAIWAFVFGLRRYDVGNDTPGYADYFNNIGSGSAYGTIDHPFDTIEEGFWLISKFFNFFTENATIVFLVIGALLWTMIFLLYKKQSKTPLLSLLFLMAISGKVFYTLEIAVRQACSIIIILMGVICFINSSISSWRQIYKSKWAIAGLFLFMASVTVHRTTGMLAAILLLVYFIRVNKIICYTLVLGFAVFVFFGAKVFGELFDTALLMVGDVSDDNVNLLAERYMGDVEDGKIGYSSGAMIGCFFPTLLTVYLTHKEKVNGYFFKLFIFTYCLHQLMQFSTMHERLITMYMVLGFTASIPEVCYKNKKMYFLYLMIGLYYLIFTFKMFYDWPLKSDTAVPYYFIWQ